LRALVFLFKRFKKGVNILDSAFIWAKEEYNLTRTVFVLLKTIKNAVRLGDKSQIVSSPKT